MNAKKPGCSRINNSRRAATSGPTIRANPGMVVVIWRPPYPPANSKDMAATYWSGER